MQAVTLYEVEEHLQALLDTEALVEGTEQEAQFRADLQEAIKISVEKRDRVAAFIRHCGSQVEFAKAERERLAIRQKFFERAAERMQNIVLATIKAAGTDAEGKYKKLEGQTVTFSARAGATSVRITDEALVPAKYKTVETVVTISKVDLKKDLKVGEVAGAELITGEPTLIVK